MVGIPPETGYGWVRKSGIARRRPAPRVYSAEDKARFFRLLAVRQNVSAVARELGFVRITCYKWAHQAGIFTGKSAEPRREEFLRLRRAGRSRAEAAAVVGADKRSAQDWDKGIRVFYGGRVYPDGRVVRYRQDQILAGVKSPRGSYRQQDRIDLERVERVIDRRYLSLVERERLHDLRRTGMTIRAIATTSRRNSSGYGFGIVDHPSTARQILTYQKSTEPGAIPDGGFD